MHVLISTGLFYPSKLGGPAKTLFWLAKGLISKGIAVSVVTTNNFIETDIIEFDKWTEIDKIKVRYCSANSKLPYRIILHSIRELKKCDVVLLSSIFYQPLFVVALFALVTNKKFIWSPRGELFDSAIRENKTKLIYLRIIKLFFAKKSIFHATSQEESNLIKNNFGDDSRIVVIPNYIELPEKQENSGAKEKYLLYVGRIAPIKALDKLLLGLAKSKYFMSSDYKLFIAGGVEKQFESYSEQLQLILRNNESLKKKVIFIGNVEGVDKYILYADAYFTFLVSHSENFGNVVIESLSQGTPVISSKGTPWQELEDKKAGFWIDNDENSIANCVEEALKMRKEEYTQIRENAYNLAKEFDIYTNVNKWINILK